MENEETLPATVIRRGTAIQIIVSAITNKKYKFARNFILRWLGAFPGDLEVKYYLAEVMAAENKNDQALDLLHQIIEVDPEYLSAYQLLVCLPISDKEKSYYFACIHVLGGNVTDKKSLPVWSPALHAVKKSIAKNHPEEAGNLVLRILSLQQENPIIGLFHLRSIYLTEDDQTIKNLAELYQIKWPSALAFRMILAEKLLETGEEDRAVSILHDCVGLDTTGQVARRWWGDNHQFLPLWPENHQIDFDLQIPNEIASDLGWNRLPVGKKYKGGISTVSEFGQQKSENRSFIRSEIGRKAEKEFERIAKKLRKDFTGKIDGRFPVYVILTTNTGLTKQYGVQTFRVIAQLLQQIRNMVQNKPGWDAELFIPDDKNYQMKFGLSPIDSIDPAQIKRALQDLDGVLSKRGERIGALLIIGGDEVVPFHRLPNPTDDIDEEIYSDNPYSTLEDNYFIPDWPTGRLVGEKGNDAGLLIQQVRSLIKYHAQPKTSKLFFDQLLRRIAGFLNPTPNSSLGYTASVWKRSSMAVYRSIGDPKKLQSSPDGKTQALRANDFTDRDLGYYNLHGLEDRAEWYGQRDFLDPPGVDYPVALTPEDIRPNGKNPKIVFTEACYGAHIFNKVENQSNALKFLSIGTPVVIGSTCTSYGSISTPLIAADLLAKSFWQYVRDGFMVGESFQRAKIAVAQEMMKRQGYLDGEDQKTLIQFVMYGDPFYAYDANGYQKKRLNVLSESPKVKTVSDLDGDPERKSGVPMETISLVKSALEPYLPGIEHAKVQTNYLHYGSAQQTEANGVQKTYKTLEDRIVITLRNPVQLNKTKYYQIARVTVDSKGTMLKMAISR